MLLVMMRVMVMMMTKTMKMMTVVGEKIMK
jgi:hypothetical protein